MYARRVRTLVVFLSVALIAGCKNRSADPQATPGSNVGSGSAPATGSGSGSATASAGSGSDSHPIKLPKGDGTPPKKSTGKLDQAMSNRLAALDFEGFKKDIRFSGDNVLEVRHNTIDRPTLGLTINAGACVDCPPMDLEKWKARSESIKQLFPKELRDRSDSIWEMGQTEVNGQPMIYVYQFGHQLAKDEQGNPSSTVYANAYFLYYNDGTNQIRVVAEYKDDPVSRQDLERLAPRKDLEKLAKAFMDAFTHAW